MNIPAAAPKQILLALTITGCLWVILTPSDQVESNAAFGLLGVVVAYLCRSD